MTGPPPRCSKADRHSGSPASYDHDHAPPITEDGHRQLLPNTPGFFERHASCWPAVADHQPARCARREPAGAPGRMLREKIKGTEHRIMEMVRNSTENAAIAHKVPQWTGSLLQVRDRLTCPRPWSMACAPCSIRPRRPCGCGRWLRRTSTPTSPGAPATMRGRLRRR